jgi:hypothetical protein
MVAFASFLIMLSHHHSLSPSLGLVVPLDNDLLPKRSPGLIINPHKRIIGAKFSLEQYVTVVACLSFDL